MKLIWLLAFLILTFTAKAAEPLIIKELNLGDSEELIRIAYPTIECHTVTGTTDRRCEVYLVSRTPGLNDGELLEVGGQLSELTTLYYIDDKLSFVSFYMGSDSYPHILEVIQSKYGSPTSRSSERVQNLIGAKFKNEIVRWRRDGRVIQVERFYRRIDHMMLSLYSQDYSSVMARRQRETTKKAVGRL